MPSDQAVAPVVVCEPAAGWWHVRCRPAGPAGCVDARLPDGITVRTDRLAPHAVLDVEIASTGSALPPTAAELIALLCGSAVAERITGSASDGAPRDDDLVDRARLLCHLLGRLDELPGLAAADLAYVADDLARLASGPLAELFASTAVQCAAQAAHVLRGLPSSDETATPEVVELFADVREIVGKLVGDDVRLGGPVAAPARELPILTPWQSVAEPAAVRGPEQRDDRGDPIEVVARRLAVGLADVRIRLAPGLCVVSGMLVPAAQDSMELPRFWARAADPATGAVLYEAQCVVTRDSFAAELAVTGQYGIDFTIDFTHELGIAPTGVHEARAERARALGARAAGLQEGAQQPTDWLVIGELWERCAELWRGVGDPARRGLSFVHAIRAYRAAGPAAGARLRLVEREAAAVLNRLEPRWQAPDITAPAEGEAAVLRALRRTAALTPYLDAWVARALDAERAAADAASDAAFDDRATARIDATARIGDARSEQVRAATARARVALAHWAARTGRRRLAHSLLVPVAIDYLLLDQPARAALAETNRLLAAEHADIDPDDPGDVGRTE